MMIVQEESFKIFISYEREDAAGWAGSIYRDLNDCYGDRVVFKDEEQTRTGTVWPPRLERLVKGCHAFVLIIGPGWTEPRVVAKLNDPDSWVHKEIVTAIDANKQIFPVVIEGAAVPTQGIPNKIGQALNRQHFRFRRNSNFWRDDIERLCKDMEKEAGVPWPGLSMGKPASLDPILCRLDRQTHIALARDGIKANRLFVAYGAKRAGFRYFALRCALELVKGDSPERPIVMPLTWERFTVHENSQTRRKELMIEVGDSVFTRALAGDGPRVEKTLTECILKNTRPTVTYCAVPHGTDDEEARIQEWFAVWRDLLKADQARTIVVMLFIESGWWPWAGSDVQRLDCGGCVVRDKMGKISQPHLDEWLNVSVQRLGDERLRHRFATVGKRLYRYRWGRHFDDIGEAMQEAMQDTAGVDSHHA